MKDDHSHKAPIQKAVIYCRVSGKKQVREATGLDTQEYRCRQYAAEHGYEVEAVFPDDVSGGGDFMNRKGMVALLRYLEHRKDVSYVVIFDDLKRFARDTEFHLRLRREFELRDAQIECLNFRFEDTPEGKFVETIFAAQGQLEREQNARQVVQKMTARIEQGFWVFRAPVGYKYVRAKRGGKELVRDEPLASVIVEGLQGFISGRFATQAEVKRFLETCPEFPKDLPGGHIRQQTVARLMDKVVYAGYVEAQRWSVSLRRGRHEGLITLEDFERIQAKRAKAAYVPARKDLHKDFVLRGAIACSGCGRALTAGWSRGKYKRYAYYFCNSKGCTSYGKSIPRAKIESAYEQILDTLTPTRNLAALATAMFKEAWSIRAESAAKAVQAMAESIEAVEQSILKTVESVVQASNPRVISAYEKRIDKLEREKLILQEKADKAAAPTYAFDEVFELSMSFLKNPRKLWDSKQFELQRAAIKLTFAEMLVYDRKTGFRTPKTTLPFKALGGILGGKSKMVLSQGIEPWTSPLPRERIIL